MTIGSWQNLAKAKFMNLKMDDRPIVHTLSYCGFMLMIH